MSVLAKPTNGGLDYPTRIGALFDAYDPLPRNFLRNGAMEVSQRFGLSNPTAVTNTPAYHLDGWAVAMTGTAAAVQSQSPSSGVAGFRRCAFVQRNSGTTSTGTITFMQVLETVDTIPLQGKTVTLSLYANAGPNFSGASGTFSAQVYYGTGTDQSMSQFYNGAWTGQTVIANVACVPGVNTWQQSQVSFVVPSGATQIGVFIAWTPTGTAGVNDWLAFQGVKLEIGSVASGRHFSPFAEELVRCMRYYEKSYDPAVVPGAATLVGIRRGVAWGTTNVVGPTYLVPKRATPTFKFWSRGGTLSRVSDSATGTDVASATTVASGSGSGVTGMDRLDDSGATFTTNHVYEYHFTADAEL
jgi:hypothetical protein